LGYNISYDGEKDLNIKAWNFVKCYELWTKFSNRR
jgi:hypothetical protein